MIILKYSIFSSKFLNLKFNEWYDEHFERYSTKLFIFFVGTCFFYLIFFNNCLK